MSKTTQPPGNAPSAELQSFLDRSPKPEFAETYVVDMNGILRGKRLPMTSLSKVYEDALCLPASTFLLDVQGDEVEGTGMVLETGDSDHYCHPVAGSLRPLPWSKRPGCQLFMQMFTPAGKPFAADSRTVLAGVLERLKRRGLTPVVATELEFRLFEAEADTHGVPQPASQATVRGWGSQLYGLDELNRLDDLFRDIEHACAAQDLPLDTVIAEQGDGQYEINLEHVPDPLLAADQALLLKRTIKTCAQQHGMSASFMAKPYGDSSGNGLHVHASLIDEQGNNVLQDNGKPSATMMQSVAGLIATMTEATAIFAPHANSYRRFQLGSYAPMYGNWGIDNRTTALRLPLAQPVATRVEHRVAGADANPYLVLAAILAGIDYGIEHELAPPPQTHGDAYSKPEHAITLPDGWGSALTHFENSAFIAEYFGADYQRWFSLCKRQEREKLRAIVPAAEYDFYLSTV